MAQDGQPGKFRNGIPLLQRAGDQQVVVTMELVNALRDDEGGAEALHLID